MPPTTRSHTAAAAKAAAAAATQTRVQFILAQLQSFQDLFWAIQEIEVDNEDDEGPPPVGDCDYYRLGHEEQRVLQWIDSEDEIGWDCSGPRRLFTLFFLGSSDYFVGMWVGNYVEAILREPAGDTTTPSLFEQLPVYVFDFEQDDCCGDDDGTHGANLRGYLQEVVDWCRAHRAMIADHGAEVDRLQAFVLGLSENCIIDRGPYPGKPSTERSEEQQPAYEEDDVWID